MGLHMTDLLIPSAFSKIISQCEIRRRWTLFRNLPNVREPEKNCAMVTPLQKVKGPSIFVDTLYIFYFFARAHARSAHARIREGKKRTRALVQGGV